MHWQLRDRNRKEGKHCVSALLGYAAERWHHMYVNKVVYFCVQHVRQVPLAGQTPPLNMTVSSSRRK